MDVCEWPHQSHMQLYAFSDHQIRKEFEKVKEERFIIEKECEQLQKNLKTAQEQAAVIAKQYQELEQFCEIFQQNEGNYGVTLHTHRCTFLC